jgi:hypothetical protein
VPIHYRGVLLHTKGISRLPRVRTELNPLLIIPSLSQHPVQTNRQAAGHGNLGNLSPALVGASRKW